MREVVRWGLVSILVVHGLIHLLGAAKGFGWAAVPALEQPIGSVVGSVWLAAGLTVIVTGVLLGVGVRWWWIVGAVALVASQTVIVTSWSDARAGTFANIILLVAVVYGFSSQGPTSFRAEYRHQVGSAWARLDDDSSSPGEVTEADLAHLPDPVAVYVRRCGVVGKPHITGFRARIHGRIRASVGSPWMRFTGEQANTCGRAPSRVFFMDATMHGLPVDVLHTYVDSSATMRVKLASLVPMVNASGPQMDQAETVTLFNDLCLMAPAALPSAHVRWQPIDDHRARGFFANGDHIVSAELVFNDDGDLVDFVSEDRLRASRDGGHFTAQRWSTPVRDYCTFDTRRVVTSGEGRWHAPGTEGEFTYLEFNLDDLHYTLGTGRATGI